MVQSHCYLFHRLKSCKLKKKELIRLFIPGIIELTAGVCKQINLCFKKNLYFNYQLFFSFEICSVCRWFKKAKMKVKIKWEWLHSADEILAWISSHLQQTPILCLERLNLQLNDFFTPHKDFWILQKYITLSILHYWGCSFKKIKANMGSFHNNRCT